MSGFIDELRVTVNVQDCIKARFYSVLTAAI